MLINFLETSNGRVVVDGINPQPFAGSKQSSGAGAQDIMTLVLPRDANGIPVNGVFGGEALIEAFDLVTGDTYFDYIVFVVKRAAGVSSYVASSNPLLSKLGSLAGATDGIGVLPSGDFVFRFIPGTANAMVISGMGIALTGIGL